MTRPQRWHIVCNWVFPLKKISQMVGRETDSSRNAESNAEYKGMDTENLIIEHISSHRGMVIRGAIPRAFGRVTPFNTPTTHVQVVLVEA